jgi:undecaprenyl-diphosphatase
MVLEAIIFGIMQGILEWLPISSQGNLVLLMAGIFGYASEFALKYSVFLHTGTLLAVLIYFRKDVVRILKSFRGYRADFSGKNRLLTFLIITTILTGLIGYPIFKLLIISNFAGEIFIAFVGVALIVTGLVQRFSRQGGLKTEKNLGLKDSVLLGIAQGVSAIPGISRSGITVSSFLLRGYSSEESLRLSFLMSIPAVLAAEIGLALIEGLPEIALTESALGIISAFVIGLLSIHVLLKISERIKFWAFCIIIGIIALMPLLFYI